VIIEPPALLVLHHQTADPHSKPGQTTGPRNIFFLLRDWPKTLCASVVFDAHLAAIRRMFF
jgi:hypothetical protein